MSLPNTENYNIVITDDPEHVGTQIYGVQNKETEVIEYYDNLLPRTYHAMKGIDDKYKDMVDIISGKGELKLVLPEITEETQEH